jgi:phage FluMu protein Com
MTAEQCKYMWRCVKCSNHFASIMHLDGIVRIEKKCPKCKCVNLLNYSNGEISLKCKISSPEVNNNFENEYGYDNNEFNNNCRC